MRINKSRILRFTVAAGLVGAALTLGPTAMAGVHIGFNVNMVLPPGVNVSVGNYDPYYVGRVYYQPVGAWREVYSFPVQTPYGVVYQPYVYDRGHIVCQNYVPGFDAGYGQVIIEGRGHYDRGWQHPVVVARVHADYDHHWDGRHDWDRGDGWGHGGKHGDHGKEHGHGKSWKHGRH